MKSLLGRFRRQPQPFLAPLGLAGRLSRLPPAAAPLAVTVAGAIVLVAVLGALLGREPEAAAPEPAPVTAAEETYETPAPAIEEDAAETAADLRPAEPEEQPEPEPDPARTASILTALPGAHALMPSVPVAETEEEVAALEEIQRREVEDDVGPPSPEMTASFRQQAPSMRPATTTRYVNLRAGPDDGAQVLAVVPERAAIDAEEDCGWCEVTYQGRSGYIYKSFIRYD